MAVSPRMTLRPTEERLDSSRAEIISRIWQAIAFIEEIRSDLHQDSRERRDPAATNLTEATQHLILTAGILGPRVIEQATDEGATGTIGGGERRRNAAG